MSRPLRKPNIEPSVSTCTSRPAASQALRNQSRTCLSSGPSVSRRTPPLAWRRISRFRGWCPTAGRNRSADWMRFWSFGLSGKTWWCVSRPRMVEPCRHHLSRHGARSMIVGLAKKEQSGQGEPEMLPSLQARLACRAGMADDHGRRRQRLRPGQSRDPAGETRGVVSPVLPAQPETVSRLSACPMSATPAFPRSGSISISAPTCRATGSGATARWWRSRPTSWRIGATISWPSCSAARFRSRKR